jgi:hypothetical protein
MAPGASGRLCPAYDRKPAPADARTRPLAGRRERRLYLPLTRRSKRVHRGRRVSMQQPLSEPKSRRCAAVPARRRLRRASTSLSELKSLQSTLSSAGSHACDARVSLFETKSPQTARAVSRRREGILASSTSRSQAPVSLQAPTRPRPTLVRRGAISSSVPRPRRPSSRQERPAPATTPSPRRDRPRTTTSRPTGRLV